MDINLAQFYDVFVTYLSVGSLLQNVIFYSFMLLLILTNIILVKGGRSIATKETQDNGKPGEQEAFAHTNESAYEGLLQRNIELEAAVLKTGLLALGEELELLHGKSKRLSDQVSDILDCLDLNVSYDGHLWNWSIDFYSNELSLSDYGLQIRGHPQGKKLTWMESLDLIDEQYRKQVEAAITISLQTGADYSMSYKIKTKDGKLERWIRSFGKVIYSADGTPMKLEGKFTFTSGDRQVI
jgi:PAS domain-containing protein